MTKAFQIAATAFLITAAAIKAAPALAEPPKPAMDLAALKGAGLKQHPETTANAGDLPVERSTRGAVRLFHRGLVAREPLRRQRLGRRTRWRRRVP